MNLLYVAIFLSILSTLPQLYQTLSVGALRGIHPWTLGLAFSANFFIGLQGYMRGDIALMILGGWLMMYYAILTQYTRNTAAS